MTGVPLGKSDWRRHVADEADIPVLNRYFETNPTNLVEQVALLARPSLRRLVAVGEGPIRSMYSQPGSFDDDLFVVSYDTLYRVASLDLAVTSIGGGIFGSSLRANPSMTATARIGSVPEYLYIADGRVLWCYSDDSSATGTLLASGAIANGDTIRIGSVYYQWTSGSVDTGTPNGTSGTPWLVALGGTNAVALDNMRLAINNEGVAGTTYSTGLTSNADVVALSSDTDDMRVSARAAGTGGNSIVTTETGANIAWGSGTLTGGGGSSLFQVNVPDDLGVVSVGFIAGYVICVVAQGQGVNGRFYWINPGETWIEPQNFATAERAPDPVISVRVIGDRFWLLGTNSSEVWYPTGTIPPFQRVQGNVFDRGVWEGSDVAIKDSLIVTDQDGVVYLITGAGPQRISNHSIEERIRNAIQEQKRHL
jgi:hypothetical protein